MSITWIKAFDMLKNGEYIPDLSPHTFTFLCELANNPNIDDGIALQLLRILDKRRKLREIQLTIVVFLCTGLGALIGWLVTDAFYQIKMALP